MAELFTIGKLAASSDVGIETIRFYERKGILRQPKKRGSFRQYPSEYVDRILFVKRSQELGFTLKEAKGLLDLRVKDHAKCGDVMMKAEVKIKEIREKIRDLNRMKDSLVEIVNCCEDRSLSLTECPILDSFVRGN